MIQLEGNKASFKKREAEKETFEKCPFSKMFIILKF